MRDIVRDIVRDILALSVSQELRMNLYSCTEPSPFFIELIDGRWRTVALELGADGGDAGGFAFGKIQLFLEIAETAVAIAAWFRCT